MLSVHVCAACVQVGQCPSQKELHVLRPIGRKGRTNAKEQQDEMSVSREEVGRGTDLSGERVGCLGNPPVQS